MVPLGLSINRVARDLRVPVTRMSEIVNGRRSVTADTALRLARYFAMTPQFWMNLQAVYDPRRRHARIGRPHQTGRPSARGRLGVPGHSSQDRNTFNARPAVHTEVARPSETGRRPAPRRIDHQARRLVRQRPPNRPTSAPALHQRAISTSGHPANPRREAAGHGASGRSVRKVGRRWHRRSGHRR